jgi:hypothetical protein
MTLLESLGYYLQSLNLGIVNAEDIQGDIFFNMQPDSPDNCITITDTGGYPSDDTGVIRNPTFQILIRNVNYITANEKAEKIYEALHQKGNFNMESFYIYYAEFGSEPAYIGEDQNNRAEISMNLMLERRS